MKNSDMPVIDWSEAPVKAVGFSVSSTGDCYWIIEGDAQLASKTKRDIKFYGFWPRPDCNQETKEKLASEKTLREHFAGLAMQGLLSNPGGVIQASNQSGFDWCNCNDAQMAQLATACADALLAELDKEQEL